LWYVADVERLANEEIDPDMLEALQTLGYFD
jgi:hypothetical protein